MKKRKNILKIIIVIILVAVLSILGCLYGSKLFSTDNKNSTNNDLESKNEPNKLETILKEISSDLEIMKSNEKSKLDISIGKIQNTFKDLLTNLENTKKEKEIEYIFNKALNFFEKKASDKAGIEKDIANFIKIYKIYLEELLKIKDKIEKRESSEKRGIIVQIQENNFTRKDLDEGRDFLLNYAHILKCFIEDIPNIKQEMQMNESPQKDKLHELEGQIWEYIKNLRQENVNNRSKRIPNVFLTSSCKI